MTVQEAKRQKKEEAMSELKLVSGSEARVFYEGREECREYISTAKITFGPSGARARLLACATPSRSYGRAAMP